MTCADYLSDVVPESKRLYCIITVPYLSTLNSVTNGVHLSASHPGLPFSESCAGLAPSPSVFCETRPGVFTTGRLLRIANATVNREV